MYIIIHEINNVPQKSSQYESEDLDDYEVACTAYNDMVLDVIQGLTQDSDVSSPIIEDGILSEHTDSGEPLCFTDPKGNVHSFIFRNQ